MNGILRKPETDDIIVYLYTPAYLIAFPFYIAKTGRNYDNCGKYGFSIHFRKRHISLINYYMRMSDNTLYSVEVEMVFHHKINICNISLSQKQKEF